MYIYFIIKKNQPKTQSPPSVALNSSIYSFIFQFAKKDIMAEIVRWFVFLTVNLTRVNKQIACVYVMQVGMEKIAQKVDSIMYL